MRDDLKVTGLILKSEPVLDYDRRVVLLTREKGKITAFARGARRQGNRLSACSGAFTFGEFRLFQGRNAYTLSECENPVFFEKLRMNPEAAYYGMYFCEMADYYGRENDDNSELLLLLYVTLRALEKENVSNRLIRSIFEIRAVVINGEYPGTANFEKERGDLSETVHYTLDYITGSSFQRLYGFTLTEDAQKDLVIFAEWLCKRCLDRKMKSLEILETIASH